MTVRTNFAVWLTANHIAMAMTHITAASDPNELKNMRISDLKKCREALSLASSELEDATRLAAKDRAKAKRREG